MLNFEGVEKIMNAFLKRGGQIMLSMTGQTNIVEHKFIRSR